MQKNKQFILIAGKPLKNPKNREKNCGKLTINSRYENGTSLIY